MWRTHSALPLSAIRALWKSSVMATLTRSDGCAPHSSSTSELTVTVWLWLSSSMARTRRGMAAGADLQ